MPAGFHKIPEIQKLLKELEEEADFYKKILLVHYRSWNKGYVNGIEHCIEKIREIIDSA